MTDRDATDDTTDGLVVLDEQGRPVTLTMRALPRRRTAAVPPSPMVPPAPHPPAASPATTPRPAASAGRRGRAVPLLAGLLTIAALAGAALALVAPVRTRPTDPPAEATVTVAPLRPPPAPAPAIVIPPAPPAPASPPRPPATTAAKRVFVHHRAGDAAAATAARRVADALVAAGFAVPEIRTVPGAVAATRVRWFFDADADAAARAGAVAARALGRPMSTVGVQDFRFYARKPRADTLEIWVDAP